MIEKIVSGPTMEYLLVGDQTLDQLEQLIKNKEREGWKFIQHCSGQFAPSGFGLDDGWHSGAQEMLAGSKCKVVMVLSRVRGR